MDCSQDLEFNDDSRRLLERAKESILLMKKKMFRSHDLILQYNNKLKECERLKGDLCVAQEEASKFKRENSANLSKVVKLEMQSADYKKNRNELEQKIAEKDIEIASDKSHLRQLSSKLEAVEEKNAEKLMEEELKRYSLEVKVKELEQELKELKKFHQMEINKLKKSLKSPAKKKEKTIIEDIKETKEIGVNTAKEVEQTKRTTLDKSVLTDEFYHIRNNPYPLFCEKCECLLEPKVDKICKIMSHPPLVDNILSPVKPRGKQRTKHNDSNNLQESTSTETNFNDTNRLESNPNGVNRVDTIPKNFVSPLGSQLMDSVAVREVQATPVDAIAPELENLRRKVANLERKMKKQRKDKPSDSQATIGNCCGHQLPLNCYGHSSNHVNPVPNVFSNMQPDIVKEIFNKIINFANEHDRREKTRKFDTRRKKQKLEVRRAKIKLQKLKKLKVSKKNRNCGSGNWKIESDADEKIEKKCYDAFETKEPHLLRMKSSGDAESEKLSTVDESWEASFVEEQTNPSENVEKSLEKPNRIEKLFNHESAVEIQDKSKMRTRGCTRTRSKSLVNEENERKSLSDEKLASHSAIDELNSISSDEDAREMEMNVLPENSTTNETISNFNEADDCARTFNASDDPTNIFNDSEPLESTNLRDRVKLRKRKRSSSPKATKRAGRSNLLGKLRALKRTSVLNVTKTSNSSTIHATRSLSRRKLMENSESEDFEGGAARETKKASLISMDDQNPCVPVKKQRIAHVPKKSTSPQREESVTSSKKPKLREFSDEICQNSDDKSTSDCTIAETKRPLTRRSAIDKLAQIKSKNDGKSTENGEIDEMELSCKRRKLLAKGNAELSLFPQTKEVEAVNSREKSPESEENLKKLGEKFVSSNLCETDSQNVTKETKISMEKDIGIEDDVANDPEFPGEEKILKFIATDLKKTAESSIVQSNRGERSLTPSISIADASIDETRVVNELPSEKSSATLDASATSLPVSIPLLDASSMSPAASVASLDASSASPAASVASHDEVSTQPAKTSSSSNKSEVSPSEITKIENSHSKNSIFIDENDAASASTKYSVDNGNLATSADTWDDTVENADASNESNISLNCELSNEAITKISDESPASPDSSLISPEKNTEIVSSQSMKPEEHVSIYDNVTLPHEEEVAVSTSFNDSVNCTESTRILHEFSLEDAPSEKPIERNLLIYETDLYDSLENVSEESDSRNAGTKQKILGNSSILTEPMKVVKELRSRQILCNPSTSTAHRDMKRMENPSDDESTTIVSKDPHFSPSDSYSEVKSLRTLLNRHLSEQKKKSKATKSKLRRAGAIKLQETAEKNVKLELKKLVESEEWTNELQGNVISRLLDFHSERTIAKSIVDFLVERATLDEPLDRTYTPPAPIMTKTQQRIVTLINCPERKETMNRIFEFVQSGIEYTIFKLGSSYQSLEVIEYLVRMFTVISRINKDRERVRILCCDAFYCIGRRAIPAIHVVLTIWPEVLPKHGAMENELPNCLVHMIKMEQPGKDPFPKIIALKKMMTNYYEYPQIQVQSSIVMKVLIKALHEKYSSDLETAILMISKREGVKWALDNVIEKGLMKIIRDDGYRWKFEVFSLLGFILRTLPVIDTDKSVEKYVDFLQKMLNSGEGDHDKQEGIVSALLSLSRHKSQFSEISDSILKWMPRRELRALTLEQLDSFFKLRTPAWWNMRIKQKRKNTEGGENSNDD